ncbi:MAG: PHP domain-containing protein, partial [Victivallaceae bacterium]
MSIELLPERGIDLHCHSLFSDGCKTPAELLEMAAAKKLRALALTDHDTTSGLEDFQALSANYDIELINGIEISSRYQNREVHIVGLYIDTKNAELQTFLSEIRRQRDIRNEQIAVKLHHLGYEIDLAELNNLGLDDKSIGRPHFARALVTKYGFESEYIVFEQLLKRGAPAYEHRHLPMPTEVIQIIHNAGGVAIWAHPICREPRDRNWTRKALRYFHENGLDGIEAY